MNTTDRVMANSVGIVYTLGVLSHMAEHIDDRQGTVDNYEKLLRLYRKTTELVQESETTVDRALRLRMNVTEKLMYPFVEACLVVAEDVQRYYLDKLDAVSRALPQSGGRADPEPEPVRPCAICVADLDRAGRVPPCPNCGRDDVCPGCDSHLDSCPFCRAPF